MIYFHITVKPRLYRDSRSYEWNREKLFDVYIKNPLAVPVDKKLIVMDKKGLPERYMLFRVPPKYCVSPIIGYLKGESSLMIFDRYTNLKYKYGNRYFWADTMWIQ